MRVRTFLLLAIAALLVGVPSALGGSAANSTNFPDSVGEDAAAPDITSIDVSNDDGGLITFKLNISNKPALTQDMFFLIFIDADNNASTGDAESFGAEYVIELDPGVVGMYQWNGTTYVNAQSQTSLVYAYDATGATIRIRASELSNTKAFKFGAIAFSGFAVDASGNPDLSQLHRDFAPDAGHGLFSYQVLTKVVLSVTAFTTAPKPAKAGRLYSVSMAVTQNTTNGPITSGTVLCVGTIAGKRVAAVTHAVVNGIATCAFRTPATAKGKFIRGTIAVVVQGTQISRPFAAKLT